APRLARTSCGHCREEFPPSPEMLMELNLKPEDVRGKKFYYGAGCDKCNNLGFRGRSGIFELITIDDELRDLITASASTDQLRTAVRKRGTLGLRESGLRALHSGVTTLEEVVRETVLEEES